LVPPDSVELILVSVVETYRYTMVDMDMAAVDVIGSVRDSMEIYLQHQQHQLADQHYAVQIHVIDGDAAQGILEVAAATGADLVVMTTHGRAGMARWILGSVAERVMQNAEQPVWLVREDTRVIPLSELHRILVPLDGSTEAERALALAQRVAQEAHAELVLLRVVPELDETNQRMLFENETAARAALEKWQSSAQHYLTELAQQMTQEGIPTHLHIGFGDPAQAVLDAANTENVDCIVMATHARRGFDRLLYGSVAASVLHRCNCPLLLVRAYAPEQAKTATDATDAAAVAA
jgi:nucleotide-binding universal stress UspA family protein